MSTKYLHVAASGPLKGTVSVFGAKNATLPIIASLLLTKGVSVLHNVPASSDILQMIKLLEGCGAFIAFDERSHQLTVDTTTITSFDFSPDIMGSLRASILVLGPLLARYGQAHVSLPGGCAIGARPIDFHLEALGDLGVSIHEDGDFLHAYTKHTKGPREFRIVFDYPSVGATENILMYSVIGNHTVTIVNASYEPEVLDLIAVLQKMGAHITCFPSGCIKIVGVDFLRPVEHEVVPDRLEVATLLFAGAITGGQVTVTNAQGYHLDIVLQKLKYMGHHISLGDGGVGVMIKATNSPVSISFATGPYPGFPTDLQAPMIALLARTSGQGIVTETVYENRFMHISQLVKMGAICSLVGHRSYAITGGALKGASVEAHDIRGACSLVLAGLAAEGETLIHGVPLWRRCFDHFEKKLAFLGAPIQIRSEGKSSKKSLQGTCRELR